MRPLKEVRLFKYPLGFLFADSIVYNRIFNPLSGLENMSFYTIINENLNGNCALCLSPPIGEQIFMSHQASEEFVHRFHRECLIQHIAEKLITGHLPLCPLCSAPIEAMDAIQIPQLIDWEADVHDDLHRRARAVMEAANRGLEDLTFSLMHSGQLTQEAVTNVAICAARWGWRSIIKEFSGSLTNDQLILTLSAACDQGQDAIVNDLIRIDRNILMELGFDEAIWNRALLSGCDRGNDSLVDYLLKIKIETFRPAYRPFIHLHDRDILEPNPVPPAPFPIAQASRADQIRFLCERRSIKEIEIARAYVHAISHGFEGLAGCFFPNVDGPYATRVRSLGVVEAVEAKSILAFEKLLASGHCFSVNLGIALQIAAAKGSKIMVQRLLGQEIQPAAIDQAILDAIQQGHQEVVDLLWPKGSAEVRPDAIKTAVLSNQPEILNRLLSDYALSLPERNDLFSKAANLHFQGVAQILLQNGPVDKTVRLDALKIAARFGLQELFHDLLGPDISFIERENLRPIVWRFHPELMDAI